MSKLLSDEKIEELWHSSGAPHTGVIGFARAIEAAVIEAQGKQEPKWWYAKINNEWDSFTREKPPEDAYDEGTLYPLYAAPVVQPDMVMVPREPTEAMLTSCWRDYPEAARETWRAMIAAAEGKK